MKFKDTKYGDLTDKIRRQCEIIKKNLDSLEGSPKEVNGFFNCSYNNLKSLEYSPKIVKGYFDCSNNNLTSLKDSPEIVNGYFYCFNNNLTSLEGSPEIINGDFLCMMNNLTTLKSNIKQVKGNFGCYNNKLKSLEGAPKEIGLNFYCSNNPDLKNIKDQIIKYQIKAIGYFTDEEKFLFVDIKEEFENYGKYLLKKDKNEILKQKTKENVKINKKILNKIDYGLSI